MIALQHTAQIWAGAPVSKNKLSNLIHIPGLCGEEELQFMQEARDIGEHSFVALQSVKPIPPKIMRYIEDGVQFDIAGLELLTNFYNDLPASGRKLFRIRLLVNEHKAYPLDRNHHIPCQDIHDHCDDEDR